MRDEQDCDPAKTFCSVEAVQNAFLSENYITERPLSHDDHVSRSSLANPFFSRAKRGWARRK